MSLKFSLTEMGVWEVLNYTFLIATEALVEVYSRHAIRNVSLNFRAMFAFFSSINVAMMTVQHVWTHHQQTSEVVLSLSCSA